MKKHLLTIILGAFAVSAMAQSGAEYVTSPDFAEQDRDAETEVPADAYVTQGTNTPDTNHDPSLTQYVTLSDAQAGANGTSNNEPEQNNDTPNWNEYISQDVEPVNEEFDAYVTQGEAPATTQRPSRDRNDAGGRNDRNNTYMVIDRQSWPPADSETANDADMHVVLAEMDNKRTDVERYTVATRALNQRYYTSEQLLCMARRLENDRQRLAFTRAAWQRTIDRQNYNMLRQSFRMQTNAQRFERQARSFAASCRF